MSTIKTLNDFINSNPDPRELKRVLAVKMEKENYPHQAICELLNVTAGFVSKWKKIYGEQGVAGLKLGYAGLQPYLTNEQKQDVLNWLSEYKDWNLWKLEAYIENKFGVKFKSKQSYYALFEEAGISWKKVQTYNPKKDPIKVAEKQAEIKKTKTLGRGSKSR